MIRCDMCGTAIEPKLKSRHRSGDITQVAFKGIKWKVQPPRAGLKILKRSLGERERGFPRKNIPSQIL